MSQFGIDSYNYLNINNLLESSKLLEINLSLNYLTFIIKNYSLKTKKSNFSLYLYNNNNNKTKQLIKDSKESLSNSFLIINYRNDINDSILYLKNGQIWLLPLEGGESFQISSFPLEVESFKVYRGIGSKIWLLCVFNVYPNKTLQETIQVDKDITESGTSGMVFDNLMIRHWDTWNCYSKRNHVFSCPLTVDSEGYLQVLSNEARDLMFGLETDCPSRPFGGAEEYSMSSDGIHVTLACRKWDSSDNNFKKQPHNMAWSTDVALFLTTIELNDESNNNNNNNNNNLKQISSTEKFSVHSSPTWSPDGKKVAFLSMTHPQYESDRLQIAIYDIETQQLSYPTNHISLSFNSLVWASNLTNNESIIYAVAQYRASNRIFQLKFQTTTDSFILNSISVIEGDESKSSPLIVDYNSNNNSDNKHYVYYLESTLLSPNIIKSGLSNELFTPINLFTPLTSGFQPIHKSSPRFTREIFVPCPEYFNGDITLPMLSQFYFNAINSDGQQFDDLVHAWYLPPAHIQSVEQEANLPNSSVPLVLIIHGGPQGAFLNSWNYRWNLAYFASKGYGVCAVNFHGSTSFGQEYCDSIRNDWGGQPYRDCIEAVDRILQLKPYLNSSNVGALGASYGGYMINWINGHTNKFKCLVNHDGIFNLTSLYYSTEELWFPEWEFGLPWDPNSGYEKFNPSNFVSQWNTPTLVIQGGKDYRVVETESISTFTALQRRNIPSRLLFFPDENHWCLKPLNSLKWHQTVTEWLDHWLKADK